MKRITFNALLLVMALQLGMVSLSSAQKREKAERIIIQRKGDKPEKMVIEIDGNKVIVNGKEVKDGDSNIIIREFGDRDVFLRMPEFHSYNFPNQRLHHYRDLQRNYERMGRTYQLHSGELQRKMHDVKERLEKRAFLGVSTDEVDKGLKITEVQKESAAAAAGLQEGDIITKVDNKEMKESEDLVETIRAHKPGDEVTIEYLRDGKKKTTKATLKSIQMFEEFKFNWEPKEFPQFNFEGLKELELITPHGFNGDNNVFMYRRGPKLGATIQDTEDGKGVTVEEVDADSPAAKSGLQKGDIITEINSQKINDIGDAREAIRSAGEKNTWSIQVLRGGKPVTIEVKFPKQLKKTELEP
jgi:serine protease Do